MNIDKANIRQVSVQRKATKMKAFKVKVTAIGILASPLLLMNVNAKGADQVPYLKQSEIVGKATTSKMDKLVVKNTASVPVQEYQLIQSEVEIAAAEEAEKVKAIALAKERAEAVAEEEARIKQAEIAEQKQRALAKKKEQISTSLKIMQSLPFPTAQKNIPSTIGNLRQQYIYYGNMFNVDPNLLMAISSQECGGDLYCTGAAKGVAQIEDTLIDSFVQFGQDIFGQNWSEEDRYNTNCSIAFMAYTVSTYLQHYNGDYLKAVQAYNYSHYSLDKLIQAYGGDWINHRDEVAYYNGHYDRTGSTRYGDPSYLEHVFAYYHACI